MDIGNKSWFLREQNMEPIDFVKKMISAGISAAAIHGNKTQGG